MITIGIDPGISGAYAVFTEGGLADVRDLPMAKVQVGKNMRSQLVPAVLAEALYIAQAGHVYLEHVGARPQEGAVGAFSFGRGFGQIEGILAGLNIPYTLVRPAQWKRALNVPVNKDGARAIACRLFPGHALSFARVKDDGRAEAALIGHYGRSLPHAA